MGEFNSKCALSGLPIEKEEPTLLLFLREVNSLELKDTYWATRLATGWQPLLFPIEGKYNNHGWIDKIKHGIEVDLILEYFAKENICYLDSGEHKRFDFSGLNFDKLTDKVIDLQPVLVNKLFREVTYYKHSFCLVSKKAYDTALNLVKEYKQTYLDLYKESLIEYLCPYHDLYIAKRFTNIFAIDEEVYWKDLAKIYFERNGSPITDSEFTIEDKEFSIRRCVNKSEHFLRYLKEAMAGYELPYITSTEDSSKTESLLNKMVDMILLKSFCYQIKHEWHHIRTLSKYDLPLENIFEPWIKFQYEVISDKLAKWKENRYEEDY